MNFFINKRVLVTGGGGFLGKALCHSLLSLGASVTSIARGAYPELKSAGVECIQADLASPPANFADLFQAVDIVFHTAAKVDMWGRYKDFYNINVLGTQQVLTACKKQKVPILVYTSSPSVVACGKDLCNVDETIAYPEEYNAFYPQTKAQAEQLVLSYNSTDLYTCSLRPHLIWGPGDTNLIPTVLQRAAAGRLVRIGQGHNVADFTYIKDCVKAHLCAAQALSENVASRGLAYFISQGEPVKLWDWINRILAIHHLPEVTRSYNFKLAYIIAVISEFVAKVIPNHKPLLTRFLVEEMATDHYFNIERARKLLSYQPQYTMEQAYAEYANERV